MKEYEALFILKPNLGEDKYTTLIKDFESWIVSNKGEILLTKPWGLRSLSETFKRATQGYYVQCQFKASPDTIAILKKNMRVKEDFMRYLVVTMDSIISKGNLEQVSANKGA